MRTECLDWVLIWNDRHLQRVLNAYLAHFNMARPHRGLGLDVPVPVPVHGRAGTLDVDAPIKRLDVLGGLIHEYSRAA